MQANQQRLSTKTGTRLGETLSATQQKEQVFSAATVPANQAGLRDLNQPKTNWYVITGGPGSGKTTTINLLKEKGYRTTIEHARHYIDTQLIKGRTVEEVRKNQAVFQEEVLAMQMEQEASLSPGDLVFLDRAIPDALAYYRFLHLQVTPRLEEALQQVAYKKIFLLDCLPMVYDYARTEDEKAQQEIHSLLAAVYHSLPFPVVHVPVMPLEERVQFILQRL